MWIRNPAEWGAAQIVATGHAMRSLGHALAHPDLDRASVTPVVNRISFADLRAALTEGFDDFLAFRDDVLFICLIYPVAGFVIAEATGLAPLIFPLFTGFALVGPFAAVWLYEMSRRREHGEAASWIEAFKSFGSPAAAATFKLGLLLIGIFALWLVTAMKIYTATVGQEMPTSFASMVHDVFTTSAGWALIFLGVGTGFLFALVVLSISVISFPLLLDRRISVGTAIATSIRAMRASPGPLLAWGFIVASALLLGMIPAMIGLVVALPVLGHATWHLYRKVVT
jgi:uncharacterized membrane protein